MARVKTNCPTCKGEKIMYRKDNLGNTHWVQCYTCSAEGYIYTSNVTPVEDSPYIKQMGQA